MTIQGNIMNECKLSSHLTLFMKHNSHQPFCINSYQDGYFNGDYGTDEDDLINQCWKFYSHDTDHCTHECISLGHAQGTITQIKYGKKYYGMLQNTKSQKFMNQTEVLDNNWHFSFYCFTMIVHYRNSLGGTFWRYQ